MIFGWSRARALALVMLYLLPAGVTSKADENEPATTAASQNVRVLVAYYSMRGNTERFAQSVGAGAQQVPGTDVTIKNVKDVTKDDLQAADAIALGSATYFANIPGAMKAVIDDWNWKWKVDFTDKVGGAFSTGGGQTGGKEFVVISLLLFMLNNRMVVAGPLYQDAEGEDIWGEIGSSAMTGPLDPGVSTSELDAARRLGHRLATVAQRIRSD